MTDTHDSEWWRRVLDAADRALDLAPEERSAFLDRCTAEDSALGAELRALLAGAEAPSPIDGPASAFAAPIVDALSREPHAAAHPQAGFGPYRILRELGRGGMGAVYLAERSDDQYQKYVALKLLPPWSAGDARRVQRFIDERQILAALDHPDIARLVDGGVTPEGLPWFALEYVDGVPIDRYCDERSLPIEGRLSLFCQVCATVQYAHRNLVVHRDLKPANILVTADGRVKMLDFGIAKLLADDAAADLTVTGERLLTPLYASPEQIRGGPISTATDVYALGVLLHVMLTGRYPYRLTSLEYHEVARAVLEQDPLRPSLALLRTAGPPHGATPPATPEQAASARGSTTPRLGRRLQGDLDAIVLKAVEKDPGRRYGTAEQLETDVRRHLGGLPVMARTGSRTYHARKFLRRHRVAVAVTAGVTMLVLGFTTVTAVQSARIRAQAERIATERDRAVAVTRFLTHLFQGTTRNTSDRGVTGRDYLDSATARIDRQRFPDPEQRARLTLEMARAYLLLNLPDRARSLAESSLALRRDRRPARDLDVAESWQFIGDVLIAQNQLGGAEQAYAKALELRRRARGARDGDIARTLVGLALVRTAQGRPMEAESLARKAISIDRARGDVARTDLAQSTRALARVLSHRGDHHGAARLLETSLALVREAYPEEHVEVARAVFDLATSLKGAGEPASDSLLRYGLGLYERLLTAVILGAAPPAGGSASARAFDTVMSAPARGALEAISRPAPAAEGPANDSRILFISDRDGPDVVGDFGGEIYVMRPNGTGQRRLTHDGLIQSSAVWSPDGRRIAFTSRRSGIPEIFVINADGTDRKRVAPVTQAGVGAGRPTWAPDGRRIAFNGFPGAGDIYVIGLDGTGLTNLTNSPASDANAAWSPDGQRIAFDSNRDGNFEIYTMDPDGTDVARLTSSGGLDRRAAWSPDGRRIAFHSNRDGDQEIYVMNADGSDPVRLTVNPGEDGHPAWSPDGRRIAFHRRVLGHTQVFVMNADGSDVRRLTELSTVAFNAFPTWGPARVVAR